MSSGQPPQVSVPYGCLDTMLSCQPSGTVARHLITLAALISGIVGSKSLPNCLAWPPKMPNRHQARRPAFKRFARG